ncbi:MAG: serine/threonine protein kinase [Deltaproteobacteria bacterium]|nr:serine/threonine protein kinase [Deltaproteobacteria bacterium]
MGGLVDGQLSFIEGDLFAERYRIVREIGSGGMGKVYLVHDQVLEMDELALKVLLPELCSDERHSKRFLREVQLTRKVTNENVVRTYDVGSYQGLLYFTLEYVNGKPLTEFLESGVLPPYETCLILLQVCRGLSAIHQQGIIHRDLKPANVLLTREGVVKIADFGIARPTLSNLTSHEEVVGSAPYMSPEIWRGTDITHSADIYALGVMAYELLTGIWPFDGETAAQVMCSHFERTPPQPSQLEQNVPVTLSHVVMQMLEKDPADRPESAEALIGLLEREIERLRSGSDVQRMSSAYFAETAPPQFGSHAMYIESLSYQGSSQGPPCSIEHSEPASISPPQQQNTASMHSSAVELPTLKIRFASLLAGLVQFCILACAALALLWLVAGPITHFLARVIGDLGAKSNFIKWIAGIAGPLVIVASVSALPFLVMVNRKLDMAQSLSTYIKMVWNIFLLACFMFFAHLMINLSNASDTIVERSGISFSDPAEKAFFDIARIALLTPASPLELNSKVIPDQQLLLFVSLLIYCLLIASVVRKEVMQVQLESKRFELFFGLALFSCFCAQYYLVGDFYKGESLKLFSLGDFLFIIQPDSLLFMVANWALVFSVTYGAIYYLLRKSSSLVNGSRIFSMRESGSLHGLY